MSGVCCRMRCCKLIIPISSDPRIALYHPLKDNPLTLNDTQLGPSLVRLTGSIHSRVEFAFCRLWNIIHYTLS